TSRGCVTGCADIAAIITKTNGVISPPVSCSLSPVAFSTTTATKTALLSAPSQSNRRTRRTQCSLGHNSASRSPLFDRAAAAAPLFLRQLGLAPCFPRHRGPLPPAQSQHPGHEMSDPDDSTARSSPAALVTLLAHAEHALAAAPANSALAPM